LPIPDDGRISHFDNGDIYWWPDVGAIELNEVIVHYTGLFCFGETSWDHFTSEDEPYVILGTIAPNGGRSIRSKVYEDVDAGESRPDVVEIFRGKPAGIALNALFMEHDEDDPDKYKAGMQEGINAGIQAACSAATLGVCSLPGLKDAIEELAKALAKFLSDLLDLGDDELGLASIPLSQKQMVVLAARTPISIFQGIGYKVETPLLGASEGASYKVYFNLVTA
jgi:hypothetical protein